VKRPLIDGSSQCQKALKVTPELTAKGAAIGQKRIQDNVDELKQMISEEAQRIQQLQKKQ